MNVIGKNVSDIYFYNSLKPKQVSKKRYLTTRPDKFFTRSLQIVFAYLLCDNDNYTINEDL